ncbi:28S ribosomal protein S35, mitochondrial [Galleria mellonella]|uniref:28S ribosomal protein S35, mitochondrial n=1 Tax=Galleria mellonella TaxID=7137 RepID=A0A6J1WZU3_GALME|nr:28S ribosomal protein S35, mitochondrial [Galleria mellonella]
MSIFIKYYKSGGLNVAFSNKIWRYNSTSADMAINKGEEEEEFRVLDILKKRQRQQRRVNRRADVQPDRADRMPTDQNWGNVWPGPKTFHPSSVPLPLRQGYVPKGQAPPGKKANAELMKIPNFLHLTPPVIKAQCEAIKQFCTEWPKLLNSEEAIENHYPVEIITSDYCHASPSIRNPLARIVTLRVKLSTLKLDQHARDKFIRLVGERYDPETDLVTITADRCPIRKQNQDYVNYLLTACYHESWNFEEWEREKMEEDMEYYNWDKNPSKRSLVNWYLKTQNQSKELSDEEYSNYDVSQIPNGEEYKVAVSSYMNDGESEGTVEKYGEAVRKLLGLPQKKVVS